MTRNFILQELEQIVKHWQKPTSIHSSRFSPGYTGFPKCRPMPKGNSWD